MRALLLGLLLLGACAAPPESLPTGGEPVANAAPNTPPKICGPARVIARALLQDFGERPIAVGEKNGPNLVLTYGPKSWTLIELDGHGIACFVAAGEPLQAAENDKGE